MSGAIALTEGDFVKEFAKRLGLDAEKPADVKEAKRILAAFKAEMIDCVINGYKVTLNGFGRFEARYVPAKLKGEMVRAPGSTELKPRATGEPESFKAKAFMSPAVSKQFPSTRTKAGKSLVEQLAPAPAPAKKKPVAAKGK